MPGRSRRDPAAHRADHQRRARASNVQGTPTFFINGEKQTADRWADARAAAARRDRAAEVKARALLAAAAAAVLVALPAADGAAQRSKAARPARLDPDRRANARRRLPDGQSRCAGEGGRISLARPARIAPSSARRRRAPCSGTMCAAAGSASNIATIVINARDLAGDVLSRCAGAARYFDMTHELLRSQAQWIGRDAEPDRGAARRAARPAADEAMRSGSRRCSGSTGSPPATGSRRRRSAPALPTRPVSTGSSAMRRRPPAARRHRHADLRDQRPGGQRHQRLGGDRAAAARRLRGETGAETIKCR